MKVRLRWIALTFFVAAFSLTMLAQDTGQITGTVHDSSGAAVANAKVTVSNTSQGIVRPTVSNSSGDWLVGGLPGGVYNVSIEAPGFKKFQAKEITLRVGQKLRQDATLEVGATATEITVQGSAVAPETQSSDLAGTVTGKEITQLQLNGRNFTQLATLVPGVSSQTGQDEGTVGVYGNVNYSINGGRVEYNNWELDGGDNMDNGSNGTLNVYPSIDAIAETRVLTSNYGAQYGRNGSGTIETELKSGTRSFHGDAYEFVRNDAFNARNYFQQTVPPYKKNDYGYTIGGPVYIPGVYNTSKQKTFFFWSQEWRKDRVPGTNFNREVPTLAERGGNFSDVCPGTACPHIPGTTTAFPGNTVPLNPNGVALENALIPTPNSGANGFVLSPIQPTNWRQELLRLDHNFTDKVRLSFHYIHDSWQTQTATPLWTNAGDFPTIGTNFKGPGVSLVARLNATASPTLLNEFVVSYTTDHIILNDTGFPNPNAWQRPASLTMGSLFGSNNVIPGINLVNSSSQFVFGEDPGYIPNGIYNSNPTYTLRDNVTKIVGRHNLQFGGFAAFRQKNELGGELGAGSVPGYLTFDGTNSAVSSGNPFADLLMGNIASFGQQNHFEKYYNREKTFEPYFQDDWRVTDRLTLNLGMRISMFGTYREKYHNAYNFDPAFYNPAVAPGVDPATGALIYGPNTNPFDGIVQCGVTKGVPVGCMQGHLFNPSPRVGFAFDPFGNGRWAIRGGYGIFWEETNGNEGNTESLENSPPGVLAASQSNVASSWAGTTQLASGYNGIISAGPTATNPLFPLNIVSIPTRVQWPYMQQWNLDVQHEIAKNTVATLSYVGSKGTHLTRLLDFNQLYPVPASANPFKPGEIISSGVCSSMTTPSGVPVTGQAALNLNIACGNVTADAFRPYLGYSNINGLQDAGSSIYHGMQFGLRHSMGGLQLNIAYTYSHSIDDSSDRYDSTFVNTYNPGASRASSNFDQRHVLNIGYVYDLPFFRGSGLTHAILGGWQWSGIVTAATGTPFSVLNGGSFGDNAGVGNGAGQGSYLDLTGVSPHSNPGVPFGSVGPYAYNPAAFTLPTALTFGEIGRNFLRNGSRTNFDMSLFKHFTIHEQVALEFRAEAFNIFNHTSFMPLAGSEEAGSIGANAGTATNKFDCSGSTGTSCIGTADFLNYANAHNARILQFGMKFLF
ncbi:MAG TPA: carboxypeptidase regulatory-like domain-containing protein [Terriglobales bacterium]|nr:carboxypeptidase regulatory-like domain-containing protein [Terriglobales bacterium]